ncbi:MAG: PD-(D/E)XK nuclease family protein [Chloroflexota bacterium]
MKQPIPLTPTEVRVLARCPLHYHFLRQQTLTKDPTTIALQKESPQLNLYKRVRKAIQKLHSAGGPARLSLAACLNEVGNYRIAQKIVQNYYERLEQDWPQMIAANEAMQLNISIAGVSLQLRGTLDRLDKTSDGGILAILFRTENGPTPSAADLRRDHAMTIYHALVAAGYPLKRPVRIQELWLQLDEAITIELSEDEYRRNLSDLREPVQALARNEVMARPGLHCDSCPFKYRGCPVYSQDSDSNDPPEVEANDDFESPPPDGRISSRKWVFKI